MCMTLLFSSYPGSKDYDLMADATLRDLPALKTTENAKLQTSDPFVSFVPSI